MLCAGPKGNDPWLSHSIYDIIQKTKTLTCINLCFAGLQLAVYNNVRYVHMLWFVYIVHHQAWKSKCSPILTQEKGTIKKKSEASQELEAVVGPSLASIPGANLLLVRTVLQRYRALLVEHTFEDNVSWLKIIRNEVLAIWDRANVPTCAVQNCSNKSKTS